MKYAFCYPGELSHGFFYDLIQMEEPPDYLFLPHFKAVDVDDDYNRSVVCPLLQGEPFYLQATFRKDIDRLKKRGTKLLTPMLDLTMGVTAARKTLMETARKMNVTRMEAEIAFEKAVYRQTACRKRMKSLGEKAMQELEAHPDRIAVVLFARSYNGFVEEAHMGIPNKIASRGILVIPYDFLSVDDEPVKPHMYWGMGRMILRAAEKVRSHPQLFGTYITNFSCGPDSFILGYFRDLMGRKPSLTLELDSHAADAGLETRVEAFLDIVGSYIHLSRDGQITHAASDFVPARIEQQNGVSSVITSSGETLPITDGRVTSLFPSLGETFSEAVAAVFHGKGYNTYVHPPADEMVLKLGRANSSCKECLPLQLTTGTLLSYYQTKKKEGEVIVYFYATGSGPCRFGQYAEFMKDLIRRLELRDVALLSVSSDDAYSGVGHELIKKGIWAIIIADIMEDVRSMILANAASPKQALLVYDKEWRRILTVLENQNVAQIENQLRESARHLSKIPIRIPVELVPKILLTGEIFVRRDPISRQYLTEELAEKGFATICSPISEWLQYCDYILDNRMDHQVLSLKKRLKLKLKMSIFKRYEKRIKRLLARSGLVHPELIDMKGIIENSRPYISPRLTGEAALTIGSAITDVASHTCGVIAIGPFGCMPNRLSESILSEIMTKEGKLATDPSNKQLQAVLTNVEDLPFLAIESDGSPFPQLIHAKLEAFYLSAKRLHRKMSITYHTAAFADQETSKEIITERANRSLLT